MTFPEADIFLKSGECAGQTMLDTMEAPGHSRQLLLQLNNQRTKGFLCDVIIVVQNALFRAHKNVLAASSAYLKSLVVHDNLLNLDHDMVSPAVFRLVLDFIYTGRLADGAEAAAAAAVAPGAEPSLGAVLAAASYLQIPDLVALCKKRLKRHGKYCHLRGGGGGGGGYAPYGRPGRGLRAATPVIQACYSSPASPGVPALGLAPPRYHGGLDGPGAGGDGDDYKSSSEETGSSEDPSPPGGHLEGYPCPHLAYGEPESFGDNLYVCIPCGKGFPSSEQLNAHVEAHVEEEEALYGRAEAAEVAAGAAGLGPPFGGSGDKVAGAPGGLGELLRPYRCASCDKSYKDPATLRQHEKTHWLTRPYPCTICGKKFTQRGTMTRHMRSHLGLKPFACDACGMRFTRQYRLTEHMRIHSGEKPYECQVCGGKFAQQRNLISHMKMHAVGGAAGAAGALAGLGGLPGVPGPDGKGKLDFPEGVFAVARLTAEQLSLKQQDKAAAAELLAQTTHFLHDPKVALESLYPLAKFTAELGLSPDKAAEVLSQGAHLAAGPDGRTIDRFSPT
ncbi:hypermethylated in cancer 1 protein [Leptonychotes weddellii]|uniref:Hypermethylated in cancer 1 protein n=1 Tax=Leptonychotes weddellii TaxID=9713 RepID=A0A2U3YBC3_LEPWE|nr:hypermethylated in cancer 1 protein [Leptonychotes weddellii]